MSLQQFISQVRTYDVARPNQYIFRVATPTIFRSGAFTGTLDIAFTHTLALLCNGVLIPTRSLASASGSTGHRPAKDIPFDLFGDPVDFTATFYVDSDYFVRDFFEKWIEAVDSPNTFETAYFDDIVSPAVYVQAQNRQARTMYEYNFIDAFPKQIGALSYDYKNNDEALILPVTFRASYMTTEKKITLGPIDL